jgi:hypothetical protein
MMKIGNLLGPLLKFPVHVIARSEATRRSGVEKQDCQVAGAPRNDMFDKLPLRSVMALLFHQSS